MTSTATAPTWSTAAGRDPDHCTEVRWCDRIAEHSGPHAREIGSRLEPGPRGDPTILAVRLLGEDRKNRQVELQLGQQLISLDADGLDWLERMLHQTSKHSK